jgi:hypothetical protein
VTLSAIPNGRGASPSRRAHLIQLVDALIEHYVSWREECSAVESSYESWSHADSSDRALAFSACIAALDREELAAASYRRLIAEIAQVQTVPSPYAPPSGPASAARRSPRSIAAKIRWCKG